MEKFKVEKLIAATYVVNNSADAGRAFDITAEVKVANGKVRNIQNGKVTAASDEIHTNLADFNDFGILSSSIYDVAENIKREDVFNAISAFCNNLRNTDNISL